MTEPDLFTAPLFDDNPADEDLLGFAAVAAAIVRVVRAGGLDPVTVGVQGAWGGGKSTVLNLVAQELDSVGHVLVVRVDPWEFEDSQDVRGTLIALVLNALQGLIVSPEVSLAADAKKKIVTKLNELRRRIAWGRVAGVLINSAVSLSPDIPGLIEALTPEPPKDPDADVSGAAERPQSMAGFRSDFEALMNMDLGLTKVVVLVDDLDRCLPPAAVATLEAIKLFLSVKKMAFVLAADEDLVRASIDAHLGGLSNGDFAARYTEKIVQLPISLPVLSQDDAEAYVALLLGRSTQMTGTEAKEMTARAMARRREGRAPYVVQADDGAGPGPAVLSMAATIGRGLSADMWQTPRAVKRFLNNLAIRQHLADAAGAQLPLAMLVRMYLLELRHPTEFKALAALPSVDRSELLHRWEEWGREVQDAEKPDEVDERTREWAASEPPLAGLGGEIDRYLSLAATLRSDVKFGGAMDAGQRELLERLMSESDITRRAAVADVLQADGPRQDLIVNALGESMARLPDPEWAIESLARLAEGDSRLMPVVTEVLRRPSVLRQLQVHHVPQLSGLPNVLQTIVSTPGMHELTVSAAQDILAGG